MTPKYSKDIKSIVLVSVLLFALINIFVYSYAFLPFAYGIDHYTTEINVGKGPDAVDSNPITNKVCAGNVVGNTVSVIN